MSLRDNFFTQALEALRDLARIVKDGDVARVDEASRSRQILGADGKPPSQADIEAMAAGFERPEANL